MKLGFASILAFACLVDYVSASVTLNTQFGYATNSSGVDIPDDTLWILVVDNGDNNLPGGLTSGAGLTSSLVDVNIGTVSTAFNGLSFSLGSSIGSDTVFAVGRFDGTGDGNGAGLVTQSITFELGGNLAEGRSYAFYFFPGVTYTSQGATYSVGSQVGGIYSGVTDAGLAPMIIPATGIINTGASDPDAGGTAFTNARFQAVNVVPEPSAALLGGLGVLALLRRRRD